MEFQRLISSMHPVLMLAILVTFFLASLLAQWIMPKLEGSIKPKRASETSSFIIRRYTTQPLSEDPFCAFDNSFTRNHEELTAFGSWTTGDDPAQHYGLESPALAPHFGCYTFQDGTDS